jgi:hypothetical protein
MKGDEVSGTCRKHGIYVEVSQKYRGEVIACETLDEIERKYSNKS